MKNYYLIDWDNVGVKGFDYIKEDIECVYIVGLEVKKFSVNFDFIKRLCLLSKEEKIKLKIHNCNTKNSTDFMICHLIGRIVGEEEDKKNLKFYIISNDRGFSALNIFDDLCIEFIKTYEKHEEEKKK